jgi:hypothetical protein
MNPIHEITAYFCRILVNITILYVPGSSKQSFPSGFPIWTLYAFLHPICITCFILPDLITQIPYLLKYKMKYFSYICCLIVWGHLKFSAKWTMAHWISLNQIVQIQTKASIAKSLCVGEKEYSMAKVNWHSSFL